MTPATMISLAVSTGLAAVTAPPGPGMVGAGVFGVSTVELGLRMALGLAVTLTVLAGAARLARRRLGADNTTGPRIQVRAQQQLTKHTTVHLLTTGDHNLLIATNPETTTLLAQGPHLTTTNTGNNNTGNNNTGNTAIDIRNKPNPLKQLQNKTARRG